MLGAALHRAGAGARAQIRCRMESRSREIAEGQKEPRQRKDQRKYDQRKDQYKHYNINGIF